MDGWRRMTPMHPRAKGQTAVAVVLTLVTVPMLLLSARGLSGSPVAWPVLLVEVAPAAVFAVLAVRARTWGVHVRPGWVRVAAPRVERTIHWTLVTAVEGRSKDSGRGRGREIWLVLDDGTEIPTGITGLAGPTGHRHLDLAPALGEREFREVLAELRSERAQAIGSASE